MTPTKYIQLVPSNINTLYPLFVWRKLVGIVGPLISFSFFWYHIAVFDSITKVLHMIYELNHFSKQIGLTTPVDPLTTGWHIRVWAILGGPWEVMDCCRKKSWIKKLLKVHPFLGHSCTILSSFKTVIIFNITLAKIKTKSADVLLKMITILKELRIAQLYF